MTTRPHRKAVVELPNDLDVVVTREFEAPIGLVFDVFTKEEHMRKTIAPFGEEVRKCEIDLRVGGDYHYIFLSNDGREMSFRGTFLEIERPTRFVDTWQFEGWPDVEAIETVDLRESRGVTTITWTLSFKDQAGRAHMKKFDGIEANFDNVEDLLRSLLASESEATS